MNKDIVEIKEGFLNDAIAIAMQITEFENPYPIDEYRKRLNDKKNLILTAYIDEKPVGFKIGYEKTPGVNLYSWMGGVLVEERRFGVAYKLAEYQENWAKQNNYKRIILKTRQKHVNMIAFLKKNGFKELGRLPYNPPEETRILFEKELI